MALRKWFELPVGQLWAVATRSQMSVLVTEMLETRRKGDKSQDILHCSDVV